MTAELFNWNDLEGGDHDAVGALPNYVSGGYHERYQTPQTGVSAEARTGRFLSASLERYCCTN